MKMYNDNRDLEWEMVLPNEENKMSVKKAIKFILTNIDLPKNSKVLDIGVRDGYSIECWKEFGYNNVLGTELIQLFVDYAKKQKRNVIFDDMVETKVKDKFDLVYSRHSLEHVRHTLKAIKNMATQLKCGGYLVIIVPIESKSKFYEKRPRQKHLTYIPNLQHFRNKIINKLELKEIMCTRSDQMGLKPRRDIIYIGRKQCINVQ